MANEPPAGFEVVTGRVLPEWIDVNDHMNVAYYVLAFDQGVDALFERFGLTNDYIRDQRGSTFAVESHVTWQRELDLDAPYVVTAQILAYDEKCIHQFQRMYHADQGFLAATAEWLNLHVDLGERRVAAWPESILDRIAEAAAGQADRDWPDEAGRCMGVPRPRFSLRGA